MCPDKKRPAENTCRIVKGLDAVWAHFCSSKPCLPLLNDGTGTEGKSPCAAGEKTVKKLTKCWTFDRMPDDILLPEGYRIVAVCHI